MTTDMQKLVTPSGPGWLYARGARDMLRRYGNPLDGELPSTVIRATDVAVDQEALAEYSRLCGFRLGNTVPLTYPHNMAFRMHLQLMTSPSIPFSTAGMLHVSNSITQYQPIDVTDRFTITTRAANLRRHPKGVCVDVVTDVDIAGEVVWSEVSSSVKLGNFSSDEDVESDLPVIDGPETYPETEALWSIPRDLGRKFAAISSDYNPIHVNGLFAKAAGSKRTIVQGMWGLSRSVAALEPQLPEKNVTVTVNFRRPVPLPAKAGFHSDHTEGKTHFAMVRLRDGKPYLNGEVTTS